MSDLSMIKTGFEIVSADGAVIGHVDRVEGGERLRLQRPMHEKTPFHDFIPSSWVAHVHDGAVHLNKTAEEAEKTINNDIPAGDATS